MSSIRCPGCNTPMEHKEEPDIVTELCPNCGGMFLDKGELNVLATGISGDIEYYSIDFDQPADKHPTRKCPKCNDQELRKINLMQFSDVIFDFCPGCEGFFLDRNEVGMMNVTLQRLSDAIGPEEFRGYRDDRLARIDRLSGVALAAYDRPVTTTHFRVIAYFTQPLNLGLRVFPEKWTAKLAKLLRVYPGQDIQTGNRNLDNTFIIRGDDADRVRNLFTLDEVCEALLDFVSQASPIISESGRLEVMDVGVVYTEGPYTGIARKDVTEAASDVLNRMVELTGLIERQLS